MLKSNLDDLDTTGKRGDWCFLDSDSHIGIRYGENALTGTVVIPILGVGAWDWNGDRESPTITPSILVRDNPGWTNGWHGFLTKGNVLDA